MPDTTPDSQKAEQLNRRDVIMPIEQETVFLFGHPIVAVRLPDGRIAASLTSLCDALNVARYSQVRRIRDDDVTASQLLLAEIRTDGGPQATDVLTAWAIPVWLQGIKISRLAVEKRAAILAFKLEAADVLYRHFSQRHVAGLSTLPENGKVASYTIVVGDAWRTESPGQQR